MTINHAAHEAPQAVAPPDFTPAAPRWLAAAGLAAGLGAVVASSCCVIPLGLAALGAGAGALGGLEAVAAWRIPLLSVAAFAVVAGWVAWRRRRPAACAPGSACASAERSWATPALLLCASLVAATAAGWSYIDPVLLKLFAGR
jgi:mercuric ion transport protein